MALSQPSRIETPRGLSLLTGRRTGDARWEQLTLQFRSMERESGQSVFNLKKKTSRLRRALDSYTTPPYPNSLRSPAPQMMSKAEGLKTDLSSEAISVAPDLLLSLVIIWLSDRPSQKNFFNNKIEKNKDPTLQKKLFLGRETGDHFIQISNYRRRIPSHSLNNNNLPFRNQQEA